MAFSAFNNPTCRTIINVKRLEITIMILSNFREFDVNMVDDPSSDVRVLNRQRMHRAGPILGVVPAGFKP